MKISNQFLMLLAINLPILLQSAQGAHRLREVIDVVEAMGRMPQKPVSRLGQVIDLVDQMKAGAPRALPKATKHAAKDQARLRQQAERQRQRALINDIECPICNKTVADLGGINNMRITDCCDQFICTIDADEWEANAQTQHRNLQDPAWRRNYQAEHERLAGADPENPAQLFSWPKDLEHANCPYCRHNPLTTRQATMKNALEALGEEVIQEETEPKNCEMCLRNTNDENQEINAEDFITLQCGHEFCQECLNDMLELALLEKSSKDLKCPTCQAPFTQQDIRMINNSQADVDAWAEITTHEALNADPETIQCPGLNCPMKYLNANKIPHEIECCNAQCKKKFCSQCRLSHNAQFMTCAEAKAAATPIDTASAKYIEEQTKPCPNCNKRIQKSEGCDHMTCTQCRHQFCWQCSGPRNSYFGHTCVLQAKTAAAQPKYNF